MNCRDAEKMMILLHSRDLDSLKEQDLKAHLKDCPDCMQRYFEIKGDLEWMSRLPGPRPEFDWDKSWRDIRAAVGQKKGGREHRLLLARRILPAAALGILFLTLIFGKFLLFPPREGALPPVPRPEITSRLIRQHMEEVNTTLLEYMNRESLESDQRILVFEKQKNLFLLFQNRTLQTLFKESDDPLVIPLLNDIEIVLHETANYEAGYPETHEFIKAMIRKKEIFFRIRHMESYQASKMENGATP